MFALANHPYFFFFFFCAGTLEQQAKRDKKLRIHLPSLCFFLQSGAATPIPTRHISASPIIYQLAALSPLDRPFD
jgi:hypothetical protein